MDKTLYRQEALNKVFSPEQLDLAVTLVPRKNWILIFALALLFLFLIIWGIWGKIPITIDGKGLILSETINNIYATNSGYVQDLNLKPGDKVYTGQELARIIPAELYTQFITLQAQLNRSKSPNDIVKINSSLNAVKEKIQQQAEWLVSPFTGDVVEIDIRSGSYINTNQLLLRIEQISPQHNNLNVVLFFSPLVGTSIEPGMKVQVTPYTIRAEEYGFMLGKVTYVSKYPVTSWDLLQLSGNEELVKALYAYTAGLAPIEVQVELIPSKKTFSGYQWSSSNGPPIRIKSGTICDGKVIISEQRPVNLILPKLKGAI